MMIKVILDKSKVVKGILERSKRSNLFINNQFIFFPFFRENQYLCEEKGVSPSP